MSYRSVIQLVEGLNIGPSIHVHSESDVGEVRRSRRVDVESFVEAISDESFRHSKRFSTLANGKPGDFRRCERPEKRFPSRRLMCDSESFFEREPYAFGGESSEGLFDSDSEAVGPDAGDRSNTDVEILGECPSSIPSHGIGKGLMTAPVPLSIVYSDGRHVGLAMLGETSTGRQSETSTSDRGESAAEPSSRPRVSVVFPSNPRVLMGVPKEHLFGVNYLEPNKITEREIAKYHAEYFIPDLVGMRIPTATESLSKPKEGEVVFFTDISYAPGQFNPNFWVALIGVVTAFGMAGEGAPSYEHFSHLYSVTKSKSADHGGWVQANCLKATEHDHFVSAVPTSQKTWRKRQVLLSGDWESPSGHPVRFHIPTTFQIAGRPSQVEVAERHPSGDLTDRQGKAEGPCRGESVPEVPLHRQSHQGSTCQPCRE
ncbi:unnamed protein product [Prunus armeniaca]